MNEGDADHSEAAFRCNSTAIYLIFVVDNLYLMKKNNIAIIISFTALALVGIIFIQFYWMRNALRLQEELFDNSVSVTLKSVVNRMFDEKATDEMEPFVCSADCDHRTMQVLTAINPLRLDSLMHEEFGGMEITRQYVWGVFDPESGAFFAGDDGNEKRNILKSNHRASLSCLYKKEQLILGVYFPNESSVLLSRIIPWMLISLLFISIVGFAFTYMIFSFNRQKKLSEIKSDFVNNMTHELKTPISTISLASELLIKSVNPLSEDKTRKYARMIFDENQRLQQQVEQVLQMSVLEEGTFKLDFTTFNAHNIIEQCISRFDLVIRSAEGTLKMIPNAENSQLTADMMHFQNIICNLLDNAIKYSPVKPDIKVMTRNEESAFVVAVHDNGLGISKENQKMIFEKLYRVPTGNRHDVKGFGLGLYYVKTIVEALNGKVNVRSELNKGSVFEVYIPLKITVESYE